MFYLMFVLLLIAFSAFLAVYYSTLQVYQEGSFNDNPQFETFEYYAKVTARMSTTAFFVATGYQNELNLTLLVLLIPVGMVIASAITAKLQDIACQL